MCVTWCVSFQVAVLPASGAAGALKSRLDLPQCGPPEALERIAVWHLHRVRLTVWPAALCGPLDTHRHTRTHACAHMDGLQKHTHSKKKIKMLQHIYQGGRTM